MVADSTAKPGVQTLFHVNIRVKPSDVDEFLTSLHSIHPFLTSEPECLFADLHQSPDDPGLFRITEIWAGSIEWCKTVRSTTITLAFVGYGLHTSKGFSLCKYLSLTSLVFLKHRFNYQKHITNRTNERRNIFGLRHVRIPVWYLVPVGNEILLSHAVAFSN